MSGCKKKCQSACQTSCQADDPEFDATDGAHPAWWRGCDHGVEMTVKAINQVLDALESGKDFTGYFGSPSLEALKKRLNKTSNEWRETVESALGVEPDPENHDKQWAHDIILGVREIGNKK